MRIILPSTWAIREVQNRFFYNEFVSRCDFEQQRLPCKCFRSGFIPSIRFIQRFRKHSFILSSFSNNDRSCKHSSDIDSKYYGGVIKHISICGYEAFSVPASVQNIPFSQVEDDLHSSLGNGTCYLRSFENPIHNMNDSHNSEKRVLYLVQETYVQFFGQPIKGQATL